MDSKQNGDMDWSEEDLQKYYAKRKKEFTAEELLQYLDTDEGVPALQVLGKMEAIHEEYRRRKDKEP